jgi:hypothetical protein
VEALIAHKAIKRINFIGSTRVGRIIAMQAAQHLKPVLLELSDKAPMIVLDDADLDEAVKAAAFGAFMNQGQICMYTERLVVQEGVAGEFARRLAAFVARLLVSDLRTGKVFLGSVVDEAAAAKVDRLVRDATAKGATLLGGGPRNGTVILASILDPRPRHAGDGHLCRGILRPRGQHDPREGRGGGDPRRQRHRIRPVRRHLHPRHRARARTREAHRERHLPHQRPTVHDGAQMPFAA